LQKVLIISYFFPPSNFVGGERTYAWAQHLSESGVYPIIITRNWNENQKDLVDKLDSNEYSIEKTDKYEIHRIPYKRSLRDRFSKYKWLGIFQKTLTLKELIFSNFFIKSLPYYNFYSVAQKLIEADLDIKVVITSGRPFQSFSIGHALKKKFPSVKWVPDYRDEWTTHKHVEAYSFINRWINRLERRSELKWTANADFFISVSDNWVQSIESLTNIKGKTIHNGYNKLIKSAEKTSNSHRLVITYAGSLYESQNIQLIIDSCVLLINTGNDILFQFIGTNVSIQRLKQIKEKIKGLENHFTFIDRMPKDQLEEYIALSDILMLTGFDKIKGWYPVKLFEYYASSKPILLYPTDNDVMEEFIVKSNSGFVPKDKSECIELLQIFVKNKIEGKEIEYNPNHEYAKQFSREEQTKKLAHLIKNII